MPAQRTKSNLASKLTKQTAQTIVELANKETTYGFEPLPPGIKAICQVVDCGFVEYDKDTKMRQANGKSAAGEAMFKMVGVILEPEFHTHNGIDVKIAGRQVFLTEPIFDTKSAKGDITTQSAHLDKCLNHMRLVGQETAGVESPEEIEACADGIKEGKPFFNFSTSFKAGQTKPDGTKYEDGVWENWNGNRGLENYSPPDANAVQDATGTDADAGTVNEEATDPPVDDDAVDLDALVAAAGDDSDADAQEAAQIKLKELALEKGVTEEQFTAADTFKDVKGWIENGPPTDEPEPAPDPKKGDVVKYHYAIDPKKPKVTVPVDHQVETVNVKGKTCTLKNLTSGKVVVGADKKPLQVAWADFWVE